MRTKHRLHNVYYNMKQRCLNPNHPDYHYYGGRGIRICDRWLKGIKFFCEDMDESFSSGLTLDRIDVNGDYCKENCRWATRAEQSNNKRIYTNSPTKFSGVSKHMGRWRARYFNNKEAVALGVYDTPEEAQAAINKYIFETKE